MNKSNERKMGVVLSYAAIIINIVIQLLYTPLLIRKLGQSEYGLYSLVASIIGYLTVMDFGFGNAIVVYTSKYKALGKIDEVKKMHGMFYVIFILIGIVATVLGIILYLLVPNIFGNTMNSMEISKMKVMMLILTFNLAITFPFSIYSSIINAYEKFTFQKIIGIISSVLKPILMIPLLFFGYKSITMCIIITLTNIIVMFSNYLYCKNKLNVKIKFVGFDKVIFKTIFGYSIWIFLGAIVDKINWSVDQFVLGAVAGTVAVSIYSVASQLNTLFINLSTAVSGVFLPKMSMMVANNASEDELTDEMIKVGRIQFYIIALMVTGFILIGKNFIIAWAGKEYELAYTVALILIVPICFPLIQNLGLSIMQAMNKFKFKSISTFIMAIFNVIISIFLAKLYGPVGSAIGTAIALIICNIIIINIYYKKSIGIDVVKFWKSIFRILIPLIIPLTITIIFMKFTNLGGIKSIFIYGLLYTILYSITIYFLCFNNYEKNIVSKLLKKLHLIRR